MAGILYLIPTTLGDSPPESVLPAGTLEIIRTIRIFFVEEIRTARRFLKKINYPFSFDDITFHELNEHSKHSFEEFSEFLKPLMHGEIAGIISEAGCPAVADPGSNLVIEAHKKSIKVVPLTGPSSILLALMASGMNGQSFVFHGYLPKESSERKKRIAELERESSKKNQTQIFIEAPYRNQHLLEDLLSTCQPETLLCIAAEITLPTESITTQSVNLWRKKIPDINKKPVVFLLMRS